MLSVDAFHKLRLDSFLSGIYCPLFTSSVSLHLGTGEVTSEHLVSLESCLISVEYLLM